MSACAYWQVWHTWYTDSGRPFYCLIVRCRYPDQRSEVSASGDCPPVVQLDNLAVDNVVLSTMTPFTANSIPKVDLSLICLEEARFIEPCKFLPVSFFRGLMPPCRADVLYKMTAAY